MDHYEKVLRMVALDPINITMDEPNHKISVENGMESATTINSFRATHKRFHETEEDLARIIHEFKTIQNSNKKQCLVLYKYMASYMKQRGGDDILKRRRVTVSTQHKQKSKENIFRQLKQALQKLGESKEDLTYVISQIKFFNIEHQHCHGQNAKIETVGIPSVDSSAFETEKGLFENEKTTVEKLHTLNLGEQWLFVPKVEDSHTPNLWEQWLEKFNNPVKNEILFETRCVRVEKLGQHDSATISLDKKRKTRKIVMTRKKEKLFLGKRKQVRTQIRETPPWKWGNNGRYFESVPNIPFVWRLIFDELDERDKRNIRLVSRHWKTIVEFHCNFVYNAVLTDDTLLQIDASLYEFESLSIGSLQNKIPESWQSGCFPEVKKLVFLPSVSQENIDKLSVLFQHLPPLVCKNTTGFRWLMPNIPGFHQFNEHNIELEKLQPGLKPFGGQHLTRFELSFTTFSPWQCAVFIELVISDFPCLKDFTVRYDIDDKEPFGWTGQERNHFYEVYLSIFTFIAIHLHSLKKVALWFSILANTDSYDTLPFGIDLPWLPGFPNFEELVGTLETGTLEEIYVHLSPWEQKGVFFWGLCLKLIQTQSELKRVTIQNFGAIPPPDLFENCASCLEFVSIRYPMEPFSCEILSECTNLKEFTFVDTLWKMDRLIDIDQMPTSIKKITLDTYIYKLPQPIESWILENLSNIQELVVSGWAHAHVAVTYLALPLLTTLTIQNCFPSSVATIKQLCNSNYPDVRIRYEKKRTFATGTLIIQPNHSIGRNYTS